MSDINSVYVNFWGKQKPKFTEMELALMEGGHCITAEDNVKMSFIKSLSETETSMRAKEIINERLDYSKYLPILKRIIKNTFHSINSDEDYDAEGKVNQFFYDLQDDIDSQVLKPLLKDNPITINEKPVNHLLISFNVTFDSPIGHMDLDALNQNVVDNLKAKFPRRKFVPSSQLTLQYIRGYTAFTGDAEFSFESSTNNAIINMDIRGSSIANFAFVSTDTGIVNASLDQLTNNIIGAVIHEIKHYIQNTKVAKNYGYNAQVNRFYTGDLKKLTDPENGGNYKNDLYSGGIDSPGYWLNADELNSWSANAASEINSIFNGDKKSMLQYMNAIMGGKTFMYNGAPVETSLNKYRKMIFDKKIHVNTDRETIWRKFVKDVYTDVQMYNPPQVPSALQKRLAKPR